jgi:predicted phosphodiesterase
MRFLCLSDIHGHRDRLETVLEHGDLRGFDQLVVCGDLCFPGPDPLGVWRLLTEKQALCTQGVSDRALATLDPARIVAHSAAARERLERLKETHTELGELIVARLGRLAPIAHLPVEDGSTMCVVHGSPADPTEPFTFDMTDAELGALLGTDGSDIIVCGASHVPFDRRLEGNVRIVNVGSVGESPTPGIAHATLIETTQLGIEITQYAVEL